MNDLYSESAGSKDSQTSEALNYVAPIVIALTKLTRMIPKAIVAVRTMLNNKLKILRLPCAKQQNMCNVFTVGLMTTTGQLEES